MSATQDFIGHSLDGHAIRDLVWVGGSAASSALITAAVRAARLESTLLLTGERGTGKRLLARIIHAHSTRRDAPFIELELSAGEESVADAFERAGRGIVYIDRIEQRPREVQKRLIHVLGSGPFLRPRLIASSCRDLRLEVKAGRFDDRLFYQFSTQLEVPALRARTPDIRSLIKHFQEQLDPRGLHSMRSFSAESLGALERYDWPGNVRELRAVVESVRASGHLVEPSELPMEIMQRNRPLDPDELTLCAVERQHIQRVLRLTGGRLTRAAELLGIHRNTLRRKIDQYGINGAAHE
jgi:DNA-binding NtrC family response regulator